MAATTPHASPALLLTEDPEVVAEVQRCAAGTGVGVEVRPWGPEAVQGWGRAAMVLLGGDVVGAAGAAGLRRREEVHLLCRGAPGPDDYRAAVEVGAQSVTALGAGRDRLSALLQERAAPSAAGTVVAVVGGSGGAGASTTTAALALVAARRGARVLVLDCDPVAAGVARVLGADAVDGLGWPDLLASPGRVGPVSLAEAVPRVEGVAVLAGCRGPVPPDVVSDVAETARHRHDLVLVDLPRTEEVGGVVARADRTLLVVRPGLVGVAAALRLVDSWGMVDSWGPVDPPGGVLPGLRPPGAAVGLVLRGRGAAASAVEQAVGLPLLARLPERRGVEEDVDLGLGPVPRRRGAWVRAVEGLLDVATAAPAVGGWGS